MDFYVCKQNRADSAPTTGACHKVTRVFFFGVIFQDPPRAKDAVDPARCRRRQRVGFRTGAPESSLCFGTGILIPSVRIFFRCVCPFCKALSMRPAIRRWDERSSTTPDHRCRGDAHRSGTGPSSAPVFRADAGFTDSEMIGGCACHRAGAGPHPLSTSLTRSSVLARRHLIRGSVLLADAKPR